MAKEVLRSVDQPEPPLEEQRVAQAANDLFNASSGKGCLVCGQVSIRAHAISRKRVLMPISENGDVMSPNFSRRAPRQVRFKRTGAKKVSTFPGFCARHDKDIFEPIDDRHYSPADFDQEMAMSLRAFAQTAWFETTARSMMQKKIDAVAVRDISFIRKYIGKDIITQGHVREWMKNRDLHEGNRDAAQKVFDEAYRTTTLGDARRFSTETLVLEGAFPVAETGVCMLLCPCVNAGARLPKLFAYNIFPQDDKTYGVLTVASEHESCLRGFISSFRALGMGGAGSILTQVLISSPTESIAIRPSYWSKLDQRTRGAFVQAWQPEGRQSDAESSLTNAPALSIFDTEAI